MKTQHVLCAIGAVTLVAAVGLPALAATPSAAPATLASGPPAPIARATRPRASIRLEVGRSTAWVGQAIPVVVKAQFRDVEGVTLEGAPELKSESVFTSNLAREPRQSTEVIDGEPVLVATWTGTLTPSTAGPLALSVELPARLRFHEAAAEPALQDPLDGDPLAGVDIDPSDPASIQRMFRSFQQSFSHSFEASLGRAHDDAVALKASAPAIGIRSLPVAGQPATFSGAVGRFDLRASVAAAQVHPSEPVTLRVTVQGEGDLDRVDLPGIATSGDWKVYPTTSKIEAPELGRRLERKTFEQVLIPLHGGKLTIPPVALSTFDPVSGRYTTVETSPLTISVEGAPASGTADAATPSPVVQPEGAAVDAPAPDLYQAPSPSSLVERPRALGLRLAPVLAVLLAAFAMRLARRRPDEEKSLRHSLRRAAKGGRVAAFFEAARRLIVVHFAKRWGVEEGDVTADALREHLGPTADPLVAAIASAEALRFGRRDLGPADLWMVYSSIETSLRDAR